MIQSGGVAFHGDLKDMMVGIDNVQPHPENYNNSDVEGIMESIMLNGMYRPIYVQRSTNFIVAGNHTWMACKELGAENIPVVYLDVDDSTALRLMLADNEYAKKARVDYGQMVNVLELIQGMEGTLAGTGIQDHELAQLKTLADQPLDTNDYAQWPSLCFQVHPAVKTAFMAMTNMAAGDTERFELMLSLAGWDGKKR